MAECPKPWLCDEAQTCRGDCRRSPAQPQPASGADQVRDALEEIARVAEHNSFVAAAVAPSERGLVVLGQAFVQIKEDAQRALQSPRPVPSVEEVAKVVYIALGHEEVEPWGPAHERRKMEEWSVPYSRNQLSAFDVAQALLTLFQPAAPGEGER